MWTKHDRTLSLASQFLPWLLLGAYFLPPLFRGECLFSVDTIGWTYVLRRWWVEGLLQGEWRLWNPGMFGGMYLPASPGVGIFSPFNLLFVFSDSVRIMHVIAFLTAGVGALGMYRLGLALSASRSAAVFASITYSLSGYLLSSVHNYGFFAGACLYPWAIWAAVCRRWWILPVAIAGIAFEGDPIGFAVIGSAVFLLGICRGETIRVFLALALAVLLSSVTWLPGVISAGDTLRAQGWPISHATLFSLSPKQLIQWLTPDHFGFFNNLSLRIDDRFWVDSIYLGVLPLLLALVAIREKKLLAAATLFALVLALGKYAGVFSVLHSFLPGWDRIRYPARFYAFFNLGFCLLALYGFRKVPRRYAFAVVTVTALELLLHAPPLRLVPAASMDAPSGLAEKFIARGNPRFTVLRDGMLDIYRGPNPARITLADNWSTLEGVRGVFGYDPTQPARLYALMSPRIFEDLHVWKRILGVEYVMTPIREKNRALKRWHQSGQWHIQDFLPDRDLVILRSRETSEPVELFSEVLFAGTEAESFEALRKRGETGGPLVAEGKPFAWNSGSYNARLLSFGNGEWEYESNSPVLAAVRQRYHPEWKALVGEKEVPIFRADFLNLGMVLPAGRHTVRFFFRPVSFYWGLRISLLSAIGLLGAYCANSVRKRSTIFLTSPKSGLLGWLWSRTKA